MHQAARRKDWLMADAITYMVSCIFHTVVFLSLGLVLGNLSPKPKLGDAPAIDYQTPEPPAEEPPLEFVSVENAAPEPSPMDDRSLPFLGDPVPAGPETGDERGGDASGSTPVTVCTGPMAFSPGLSGPAGSGFESIRASLDGQRLGGRSTEGRGGPEGGLLGRIGRRGHPQVGDGRTPSGDRAVKAALDWLLRHQSTDGGWSLDHRAVRQGPVCSGPGEKPARAAATALGLLPLLAAGYTHEIRSPYQKAVHNGIVWLIRNQRPNGDLSGGTYPMYSHGLATIALCEAYGMTHDRRLAAPAQAALRYIETGQNAQGGWRYAHGSADSDTSVAGWQVMALKSGLMAGLSVNPAVLDKARRYLALAASGKDKGLFGYTPGASPTPSMTAVGLLLSQYLGAKPDDPALTEGIRCLMQHLPGDQPRNVYSWYYAAQVMHNLPGPDWDRWNRALRRTLVESQSRAGCAVGSWDPLRPQKDPWGVQGGRLMVTSLSVLSLEVSYRTLPLYQDTRPSAGELLTK